MPADVRAEQLARRFHETYERLAPAHGYETREQSRKPWEQVPEQNRRLMIAVCAELLTEHIRVPPNVAVERRGDMGAERLRVIKQDDGDVIIGVISLQHVADIEFCAPGSGGGRSPRTIAALRALAEAIDADNNADPTRRGECDWKAP